MSLKDLTEVTVRGALEEYERLFSRLDIDGIVAGFADDVRVRYSNYEPFTGKERLKTFFTRRFATIRITGWRNDWKFFTRHALQCRTPLSGLIR